QAQVQFSSISAASAGIFGRLNPTNGAHYAVWIYPEDSTEQYSPENGTAVLLLIKYKSWTNYTLIGSAVPLTGIGTNWHTLRLMFQQKTNIFAYFDGALVDSATDNGKIDGKAAYTGGGIGVNVWTLAGHPYTFSVNNLIVSTNTSVVANGDSYNATNGEMLSVSAPGILANDIGNGTNGILSALLVSGPTNGNLTLAADGSFTYLATNDSATNDSFTYQTTDGQTTSSVTTVMFNITTPPPAPVILSCGLTNQIFTIEWSSVSNATYALQFTSDLTDGIWSNISPNLLAAGATMTETNVIGNAPQGFYRVVLLTN
ncbi:MAG TPA: Ig-like domain-containing protein, partial [Verrucomicrobiae bacterium]|nr:Ig-like domain-containing protein [Verrucomicrobiae bacterium]